jgi:hypothetical protein
MRVANNGLRTEKPRVDGSIPSLAIIPKFLIFNVFLASPADYRELGHSMPREGGGAGDLATCWSSVGLSCMA